MCSEITVWSPDLTALQINCGNMYWQNWEGVKPFLAYKGYHREENELFFMSVVNRMKRFGLKSQQKVFSQTLVMFSYLSVLQSTKKCVLGRLESLLLAVPDGKLNRHLSGNRSCFTKDTKLYYLPTFLLVLVSYDCMHNNSDISQRFPITVHEQTICAKQSQYAWCFLEAFYLLKQKHNSYIHLYKCLSRVNVRKFW